VRDEIFGVPLDLLTMDETVSGCIELIESRTSVQHVVINAGKVVMMQDVPGLKGVVSGCGLVNADGQSIVWAGRLLGIAVPERVAGIDLMQRLLAEAETRAYPVYFLGARQAVLDAFVQRVLQMHPRLAIAGTQDGYFSEPGAVAAAVRESGARLLFVGISSPKKEFLLSEHLDEMGPVFAMGVGGSFDVLSGLTKRAPVWMQRSGLEWFYRFLQEPGRMWKRYLIGNTRFLALVAKEWWARRKGRSDAVGRR
jgi:N-acetylglucosaminyldiphosphoundecaprenol N-acetyl-beta-D-mannosaminyltransferase